MASFTKEQINEAQVVQVGKWNRKGGWNYSFDFLRGYKSTYDLLISDIIYAVILVIDGKEHEFLSKGAKANRDYIDI